MQITIVENAQELLEMDFPVLACPLLAGVRVSIRDGIAKGVENRAVNDMLSGLPSFDGIVLGEDVDQPEGIPKFTLWVYDVATRTPLPFNQRLEMAEAFVNACGAYVRLMPYKMIKTTEGLLAYAASYDTVTVRDPAALDYKFKLMESEVVQKSDISDGPDGDDISTGDSPDKVE